MPREAPVTTAVFPDRLAMIGFPSSGLRAGTGAQPAVRRGECAGGPLMRSGIYRRGSNPPAGLGGGWLQAPRPPRSRPRGLGEKGEGLLLRGSPREGPHKAVNRYFGRA